MSYGVQVISDSISGVFGLAKFVIRTLKAVPAIKAEIADIDSGEIVGEVTKVITVEVPALMSVIKEPAPMPSSKG